MIQNKIITFIIMSILVLPAVASGSYIENEVQINIQPTYVGDENINIMNMTIHEFYKNGYSGRLIQPAIQSSYIYDINYNYITTKLIFNKNQIMNGIQDMVIMLPFNSSIPSTIRIYKLPTDTNKSENKIIWYSISNYKHYVNNNRSYAILDYVGLQPNTLYEINFTMPGMYTLHVNENSINNNNLCYLNINNTEYEISADIHILITSFMSYTNGYLNTDNKINNDYDIYTLEIQKEYNTPQYTSLSKGELYLYVDMIRIIQKTLPIYYSSDNVSSILKMFSDYAIYWVGNTSSKESINTTIKYFPNYSDFGIPLFLDHELNEFKIKYNGIIGTVSIFTHFKTSSTLLYTESPNIINIYHNATYNTTKTIQNDIQPSIFESSITLFINFGESLIKIATPVTNYIHTMNAYVYDYVISPITSYANNKINSFFNTIDEAGNMVSNFYNEIHTYITRLYESQIMEILSYVIPLVLILFILIPFIAKLFQMVKFLKALINDDITTAEKNRKIGLR